MTSFTSQHSTQQVTWSTWAMRSSWSLMILQMHEPLDAKFPVQWLHLSLNLKYAWLRWPWRLGPLKSREEERNPQRSPLDRCDSSVPIFLWVLILSRWVLWLVFLCSLCLSIENVCLLSRDVLFNKIWLDSVEHRLWFNDVLWWAAVAKSGVSSWHWVTAKNAMTSFDHSMNDGLTPSNNVGWNIVGFHRWSRENTLISDPFLGWWFHLNLFLFLCPHDDVIVVFDLTDLLTKLKPGECFLDLLCYHVEMTDNNDQQMKSTWAMIWTGFRRFELP